jgi:hypothetical protein
MNLADLACSSSAMLRVYGPDQNEDLTQGRAFFDACDGISVLSASGAVFATRGTETLFVTSATVLVQFLETSSTLKRPVLKPRTGLDVMLEGVEVKDPGPDGDGAWLKAELVEIVPNPTANKARGEG